MLKLNRKKTVLLFMCMLLIFVFIGVHIQTINLAYITGGAMDNFAYITGGFASKFIYIPSIF